MPSFSHCHEPVAHPCHTPAPAQLYVCEDFWGTSCPIATLQPACVGVPCPCEAMACSLASCLRVLVTWLGVCVTAMLCYVDLMFTSCFIAISATSDTEMHARQSAATAVTRHRVTCHFVSPLYLSMCIVPYPAGSGSSLIILVLTSNHALRYSLLLYDAMHLPTPILITRPSAFLPDPISALPAVTLALGLQTLG